MKAEPGSEDELGHSCTGPTPALGSGTSPTSPRCPVQAPGTSGRRCVRTRGRPPTELPPGQGSGALHQITAHSTGRDAVGPRPVTLVAAVSLVKDPDCPTPSRGSQEVPTDPLPPGRGFLCIPTGAGGLPVPGSSRQGLPCPSQPPRGCVWLEPGPEEGQVPCGQTRGK